MELSKDEKRRSVEQRGAKTLEKRELAAGVELRLWQSVGSADNSELRSAKASKVEDGMNSE